MLELITGWLGRLRDWADQFWGWWQATFGDAPDPDLKSWLEFGAAVVGILAGYQFLHWLFKGRHKEKEIEKGVLAAQHGLAEANRALALTQEQLANTNRIVEQLIRQAGGTPSSELQQRALTEAVAETEARAAAGDERMQRVTELLEKGETPEALALLEQDAAEATEKKAKAAKTAASRWRQVAAIASAADPARARTALAKAVELDPDDAEGQVRYGTMMLEAGHLGVAETAFQSALSKANKGLTPFVDFWARVGLGDVLVAQGNLPDALKAFKDSLAIRHRLAKADPDNAGWQRDLSVSIDRVGDVLVAQGNLPEALKAFKDSLAIADRLAKADPDNADWQRDLSVSFDRVGDVLVAQGNLPDALKAFKDSLAIADRLAKADPDNAGWQRDLSVSYAKVGDVQVHQGDLAGALKSFIGTRDILDRLAKADPDNAGWQRDLAISNERVGDMHARKNEAREARAAFERALGIYEALAARNPDDLPSRVNSVVPHVRLAELDPEHARSHLSAALDILKPLAAAGRLDAKRMRWIPDLEAQLAALDGR